MKLALRILGVIVVVIGLTGVAAFLWGRSDPPGCTVGEDPALALANERSGEGQPYREYCHEHEGQRLHVVEAGEGETILFIHGFPSVWYSMIRPMEEMRRTHRVVAIDGLGSGHSDAPSDLARYKLESMAQHLDALIEELGGEPIHIVGHDWGAALALGYAQSRPDKILSVTAMSAPAPNTLVELLEVSAEQREKSAYIERLKSASPVAMRLVGAGDRIASGPENHFEAGRMSRKEADVLQHSTADLRRIDRHINWYRANLPAPGEADDADYWPSRTARLEVPALLVWGEDDTIFDPVFIDMMQRSSDAMTVLRLEGVGHAPQFEATEEVNRALREFIESNTAAD